MMNVYYGDLHTHANVGYGKGSIETSAEVARTNLDVWAFAGHSQWPDQPEDWTGYKHHIDGFAAFKKGFDHAAEVIKELEAKGCTVTVGRPSTSGWLKVLLRMDGSAPEAELAFETSEPGSTLEQLLAVDLPRLRSGEYTLRVVVEDLVDGGRAEGSAPFTVLKRSVAR